MEDEVGTGRTPPLDLRPKLIVGLGNPGRQYQRTPHNAGFEVVDIVARRNSGTWRLERRFDAETADVSIAGNAVGAFARRNGTQPGEILAISDDINLALGNLRLRPGGSHGGHKGLLSIINVLGTLDYPRLRVGVKPDGAVIDDWVDFVLSPLIPKEREVLEISEQDAAEAVEAIFTKGFEPTMNIYNRRKPPQP